MTFRDLASDPLTVALEPVGSPVPPERLRAGSPQAARLVISKSGAISTGLWEVTPGEFLSVKDGVTEVMHFLSGAGRIIHHTGATTIIAPGTVLVVESGWSGEWIVTETCRKFFAVYPQPLNSTPDA